MDPKVSICVPVYNAEKYLRKALDSIVNQTYPYHEVIVSDNASTDNSYNIAQEYAGPKVKIVRNDKNLYGIKNYNKLINMAQGDLIALYHSDDMYEPTIVEEEVKEFIRHPQLGAVFTAAYMIDENDAIIGEYFLDERLKHCDMIDFNMGLLSFLECGRCSFLFPTSMVPKKIYDAVGPFTTEFSYAADHDMHYRIMVKAPVIIIDKKLFKYRRYKEQSSATSIQKGRKPNEIFHLFNKFLKSPALTIKIDRKLLSLIKRDEKQDYYTCAVNSLKRNDIKYAEEMLCNAVKINPGLFDCIINAAIRAGKTALLAPLLIALKGK